MIKPNFYNYVNSSSQNYGLNSLCFVDSLGNQFFFSYKTLIAFKVSKEDKLVIIQNYWKQTTAKHLNAIDANKDIRVDKETFDKLYKEYFIDNN